MSTPATDYAMTDVEVAELRPLLKFPHEFRRKFLNDFAERHGNQAVIELFSQFIGLASSVTVNQVAAIEVLSIVEGGCLPHMAEQWNLPTIGGALDGVILANAVTEKGLCAGCAYRQGSLANQSPVTTDDARLSQSPGEPRFSCHEDLDAAGKPTRVCIGHVKAVRSIERATTNIGFGPNLRGDASFDGGA